jgi:hypothetical protein
MILHGISLEAPQAQPLSSYTYPIHLPRGLGRLIVAFLPFVWSLLIVLSFVPNVDICLSPFRGGSHTTPPLTVTRPSFGSGLIFRRGVEWGRLKNSCDPLTFSCLFTGSRDTLIGRRGASNPYAHNLILVTCVHPCTRLKRCASPRPCMSQPESQPRVNNTV